MTVPDNPFVLDVDVQRQGDVEARRVSDAIDENLRHEKEQRRKRKNREVKVMLLGQAESGKSTLQKQFQLYYASHTLDRERPSWRPIVYSNILKAVRTILDELDYRLGPPPESPDIGAFPVASSSSAPLAPDPLSFQWTADLWRVRTKLLPLLPNEDALASELSGGITVTGGKTGVYVRAGWQALITPNRAWPLSDIRNLSGVPSAASVKVAQMLSELQEDITKLWVHPTVRKMISSGQIRLQESASFFLDNIQRIAEPEYLPSTEDILNVRLQTLGVTEHAFEINVGGLDYHWLLYDVGGARGQRHAWVPYFEDATAIIFLAPISAFDQYLEEDPKTNRIEDSMQLFTAICENKLLAKAALILMLNKADLLKKKLESGIKVRKFISSYGDRPNTYEDVSEYFRAHFIQVHRRKDITKRVLFLHFTSMLDITATQSIIVSVGEAIMRSHMSTIGLS